MTSKQSIRLECSSNHHRTDVTISDYFSLSMKNVHYKLFIVSIINFHYTLLFFTWALKV